MAGPLVLTQDAPLPLKSGTQEILDLWGPGPIQVKAWVPWDEVPWTLIVFVPSCILCKPRGHQHEDEHRAWQRLDARLQMDRQNVKRHWGPGRRFEPATTRTPIPREGSCSLPDQAGASTFVPAWGPQP